ncbi:MAG: family 43 glycosylhydrolase, partial [Clostridia bacterium]|nr:family 43 glycosylhydrolase [Clostridia bacterium]
MISEVQDMIRESQVDILRQRIVDGEYASLPAQEKLSWLFEAARLGKTEMLRMLAERIHGLEIRDREGEETLLHAAAESGDRETVRFCLDVLGMRLLTTDATGKSALDRVKDADRQREIFGITTEDCYQNPVVRGFHPDPSVVRVGEDYYLVNSSFAMVPALPIMHSRDLVHWTYAGHVMEDPETAGLTSLPGGFGYWAPDISFDGEKFWVVATLRRDTAPFRLQMITWARSVKGPWAPPKFLEVDGIDPSIFRDDDGQRYLVINPGVQIARLSGEGDLLEEPHMIYYGSSRKKSEGPHILKKDGYYYLLQAEGGTGRDHTETCARSRSLEGPYEPCPWNPILTCGGENSFIGRCGHGKMVELPDGRWAMVYLCGRKVEG